MGFPERLVTPEAKYQARGRFCSGCGRASDEVVPDDAQAEIELVECELCSQTQEKGRTLWIIRPEICGYVAGGGREGPNVRRLIKDEPPPTLTHDHP